MKKNYAQFLELIIEEKTKQLKTISEFNSQVKPGPNKWSKKEILGHLCDSAANNHKRFLDVLQSEESQILHPYNQVLLVEANNYQKSFTFEEVINLWSLQNKQIINVLRYTNDRDFTDRTVQVNGEVETYGWLVEDYVEHLLHHLEQIIVGNLERQ
ncbi:DinB family protein [Fontibacillus sp. BL9]|uniref:DinB family protein n=1 Tax=Fontibacillus sp. BL9 TaxID=3389971 RepID=UPI00397AE764